MNHRIVALALVACGAAACKNDQGLAELKFEDIAVTTGDFDYVEEALARNLVSYTSFEGYIEQAVYDQQLDPSSIALKSEALFTELDDKQQPQLFQYDAVVLDSGTRGFGAYVYNGVDADDGIVANETAMANLDSYVSQGGVLIASDWAYDVIEELWPDKVHFLYEEDGLDAAQVGNSDLVDADVVDTDLAALIEQSQLGITYDFSHWTVIQDVGSDVTVYLRGDVEYRTNDGQGNDTLKDVPLLISFGVGGGQVYFSNFHWRAQRNAITDALLFGLVDGLQAGTASAQGSTSG